MTTHRFFVDPAEASGDRFPIPVGIRRQVRSVLRLTDGDELVLLPGDGSAAHCRLAGEDCVVDRREQVRTEPAHRLTVLQSILKGDALETVVQIGTEVGVAAFQLVVAERCVAREISPRRLERLRIIAREAAEQSERGVVPPVHAPIALREAVGPDCVLLYERDATARLGSLSPPARIAVGPEGGFSSAELAAARQAGAHIAGLGPRILRSGSAGAAAAAVILARTGDFA